MNLFQIASDRKAEADSKRRGKNTPLLSTISIPFFKGYFRKGDPYETPARVVEREKKGKKTVETVKDISLKVKPLVGAFIITEGVCLAQCVVNAENAYRKANNFIASHVEGEEKPFVVNSTYLVEVLLSEEGFTLADYSQGKVEGAKRIAHHVKKIAEDRKLDISVNEQGTIQGVTPEIVNAVLSAT